MRKMRMSLDELVVASFDALPETLVAPGTVRAHETMDAASPPPHSYPSCWPTDCDGPCSFEPTWCGESECPSCVTCSPTACDTGCHGCTIDDGKTVGVEDEG